MQKYLWLPLIVVVIINTAVAFAQTGVSSGYGYIIDCNVDAPANLETTASTNGSNLTLSWEAVEFNNCAVTAADHYRIQIRYNDGTLIQEFDSIAVTEKTIVLRTLQRNRSYKFHVRAVASDNTETEWSDYKLFRTVPKKPTDISVTALSTRAVRATWKNVVRSQNLRYYQTIVRRGSHIIYRKKVRIGLRKVRTGLIIRRLRPATTYALQVRAVATSTVAGAFKQVRFTTPTE